MPEGMPPRMMTYWYFLEKHRLSRRQVDNDLDLDDLEWVPKIDAARARATEMKQKQAAREARHQQRRPF
jgi:CHASE1-domain containing sensor protein